MKKTLREWLEMIHEVGPDIHIFLNDHKSEDKRFEVNNTHMRDAKELLEICDETQLSRTVNRIQNVVYGSFYLPCLVIDI